MGRGSHCAVKTPAPLAIMTTETVIRAGTKIVGVVRGEVFFKRLHSSRHFLHTPPGISSNCDSLHTAAKAGARWLVVFDADLSVSYRTTIEHILVIGENLDRKHGAQLFLPMIHFEAKPERGADFWMIQGYPVGLKDCEPDFKDKRCVQWKGTPEFPDGRERFPMCALPAEELQRLSDNSTNFFCNACARENIHFNARTLATNRKDRRHGH